MRILLAALALSVPAAATAQDTPTVRLTIQRNGREIGREEYSVRTTTPGRGTSLSTTARYPGTPPTQVSATLERSPESGIAKFELDVQGPEGPLIILAAGSGTRLIVRSVTRGAEAGQEMPGGRNIVLLDESVYALYLQVADLATPTGARLTAVFPRSSRRVTFTARRESGEGGGARVQLAGELAGVLALDAQGNLARIELPGTGTVVSRASK
ncbi:MAG: hypothetical protein ACREOF_08525 [Gemmatimonadales bacterium]